MKYVTYADRVLKSSTASSYLMSIVTPETIVRNKTQDVVKFVFTSLIAANGVTLKEESEIFISSTVLFEYS